MNFNFLQPFRSKWLFLHLFTLGIACPCLYSYLKMGDTTYHYYDIDKAMQQSSKIINVQNDSAFWAIHDQAEAYSNPITRHYLDCVLRSSAACDSLYQFIEKEKQALIVFSGGYDKSGIPIALNDKHLAHSFFKKDNRLQQYFSKIQLCRDTILSIFNDKKEKEEIEKVIPLPQEDFYKNGFKNLKLSAVLAILTNMQLNVIMTKTITYNLVYSKVGGTEMCCFCNMPWIGFTPSSGCGVENEKLKMDITLSVLYRQRKKGEKIKQQIFVNDKVMREKEGVAHYEEKAKGLGQHHLEIKANIDIFKRNKLVSHETVRRIFSYEVIEPMFDLDSKTNKRLYEGIVHQYQVKMAGEDFEQLKFSSNELLINRLANDEIAIQGLKTGKAFLKVKGRRFEQTFRFEVKPVPTAWAKLDGKYLEGHFSPANFAAMQHLDALIPDFDFEQPCKIHSFTFHYLPKGASDEISIDNQGFMFCDSIKQIQTRLGKGDFIYFTDLKAACGTSFQALNTLGFWIE